MAMDVWASLEQRGKFFWVVVGMLSILGVGMVDFLTGYELAFSLFYLLPIAAVAWFTGRGLGIGASVASAVVWLAADITTRHTYSHPVLYFWNSAIRLGFFLVVTLLLSALRAAHEQQKELARIDGLTGAVNARFYAELVLIEIERARRSQRPFTVAYIDVDSFKLVNDRFGHSVGDEVLCTIAAQAKGQLRKMDIVARLGGDEFALLLPETDQAAAQASMQRVQAHLLAEMRQHGWPVTFSIGVLTCVKLPKNSDELIQRADDLMYAVKNSGKNAIRYAEFC